MERRPKRSLGQNFLVDPEYRRRIVEAARVGEGETVLEIGPGRGALTEGLAEAAEARGGKLLLVELDDALVDALEARFAGAPYVRVVRGSILDHPTSELVSDPEALKVVGNIPYNLTSPIIFHLLARPRPREILLMVQREVAERILAPPGGGEYGALSVGVRGIATAERVLDLPAGAFRPRPQVDSTVIRILPLRPSPLSEAEEGALRILTRALFQWRRKQLGKILRDHPELGAASSVGEARGSGLPPALVLSLLGGAAVGPTARPEEVSPEGFREMARRLAHARR